MGGPRAGEIGGGSSGSPRCVRIFRIGPGFVMKAISRMSPPHAGHVLVITRQVVPTRFDCTTVEQAAVMELEGEVKALLDERLDPMPDGYNVGFYAGAAAGQTVPHVHVYMRRGLWGE